MNPPPNQTIQVHNFTIAYGGRVNVLVTDIRVSLPLIPQTDASKLPVYPSKAIWDTGATGSVVTRKAAEAYKVNANIKNAGTWGTWRFRRKCLSGLYRFTK